MNAPYNWLCLDIETAGGRPEDAERDMRMNWAPASNWKPETIGTRYLEMLAKKKERLALIDGSRVISVALRSDSEVRCLHALYAHAPNQMQSGLIEGFSSNREMLVALRTLLDQRVGPETALVGHNIVEFDLPKLRMAYLREGLNLPACLASHDVAVFDTMREWGRRFSASRDCFVSVADVCEVLGLQNHKQLIDGSDVEKLYAEGKHDLLIKYNLLDVLAEADLFLRLTGQSQDEAPRAPITPTTEAKAAAEGTQPVAAAAEAAPPSRKRKVE